MNLDWLAKPGGQLFGCYVLACVVFWGAHVAPDAAEKLLFLIVGAILRDMQDSRASSRSPDALKLTAPQPDPKE